MKREEMADTDPGCSVLKLTTWLRVFGRSLKDLLVKGHDEVATTVQTSLSRQKQNGLRRKADG